MKNLGLVFLPAEVRLFWAHKPIVGDLVLHLSPLIETGSSDLVRCSMLLPPIHLLVLSPPQSFSLFVYSEVTKGCVTVLQNYLSEKFFSVLSCEPQLP